MNFFKTIAAAFAMFSRIPMPRVDWQPQTLRLMLCAFPLVGVVIGFALWGWIAVCGALGIGAILFAAGITLIPVAITGGFHLDGYCDTVDALASHAEPERKREILKDPHTGAFAVIGVCAWLLLYFALGTELSAAGNTVWLLLAMHTLSRTLSALSILLFPASSAKGLLRTFKDASATKTAGIILGLFLVICAAALLAVSWMVGGAMLLVALLVLGYLYLMSKRQFGGMNGDLAGFYIQVAELAMLAVLVGGQILAR